MTTIPRFPRINSGGGIPRIAGILPPDQTSLPLPVPGGAPRALPLGLLFLTVLGPLLVRHVLQLELQRAAHGDDQGAGVVGVHPLLDLDQPEGQQQGKGVRRGRRMDDGDSTVWIG